MQLNNTAATELARIWSGTAPRRRTHLSVALLCAALEQFAWRIQDREIECCARRIYVLYDEAVLQDEFDRRISPEGFPVGFEFDISDTDSEEEPWIAAWQLAIEAMVCAPPTPQQPMFDAEGVSHWLKDAVSNSSATRLFACLANTAGVPQLSLFQG